MRFANHYAICTRKHLIHRQRQQFFISALEEIYAFATLDSIMTYFSRIVENMYLYLCIQVNIRLQNSQAA